MLAVFSPIGVADTKITFVYNVATPLKWNIKQELVKSRSK